MTIVVGRFTAPAPPTRRLTGTARRMRVAVLAGGRSSEHEISLASAASVRDGLRRGGHEVMEVEIDRDGRLAHRRRASWR